MEPKLELANDSFVKEFLKEYKKHTQNNPCFILVGYCNMDKDEDGDDNLNTGSSFYTVLNLGENSSELNMKLATELNDTYGRIFWNEIDKLTDEED